MLCPIEKMTSLGVPLSADHCVACGLADPVFGDHVFTDADLTAEAGNGMNTIELGTPTRQSLGFRVFSFSLGLGFRV